MEIIAERIGIPFNRNQVAEGIILNKKGFVIKHDAAPHVSKLFIELVVSTGEALNDNGD
jgi:hypothetical protein